MLLLFLLMIPSCRRSRKTNVPSKKASHPQFSVSLNMSFVLRGLVAFGLPASESQPKPIVISKGITCLFKRIVKVSFLFVLRIFIAVSHVFSLDSAFLSDKIRSKFRRCLVIAVHRALYHTIPTFASFRIFRLQSASLSSDLHSVAFVCLCSLC